MFAGSVIGLQMGMGFATLFDPVQGVQVTSLASFLNMVTMLLFLAVNGHLILLAVIARSFTLLPVAPNLGLAAQTWFTLAQQGGSAIVRLHQAVQPHLHVPGGRSSARPARETAARGLHP